jgi:high-affinity nickel-transport protein
MSPDIASLYGLLLMFALGMRHGLDPDHIAMIDAMTYRCLEHRAGVAPWIGTLFAAGHGLTVTAFAVVLSSVTGNLHPSPAAIAVLDWLPVALLFIVGTLNLRALLAPAPFRMLGWKKHVLPRRLQESSHPLAIFMVGVMFALVFDTATQAAAWGYVATAQGGSTMALIVGLSFTAGMVITDTLDGRLMCRMLQRRDAAGVQTYRRRVGAMVVALAYGVVLYSVATHFYPQFELDDAWLSGAGIAMVLLMLVAYARLARAAPPPQAIIEG